MGKHKTPPQKAQNFSPVFRSWFCPPIPSNLKRILGSVCGTLSPSSDHSQNEIPIIGMRSWLWQHLEHQVELLTPNAGVLGLVQLKVNFP